MTDYKQLCAELLAAWEIELGELAATNRLAKRARAALAEPEPEGPTDKDLLIAAVDSCMDCFEGERSYPDGTVINESYWEAWDHQLLAFARAVLARWGNNTSRSN